MSAQVYSVPGQTDRNKEGLFGVDKRKIGE